MSETETSIVKTRRQIIDLKQQLDSDLDVSNEVSYTDEEIDKLLKKLPVVMFHAAQQVVLRLIELKDAKRELKKVHGNAMARAKLDPELTAAPDRKAAADSSADVEQAEIKVINAEAEYRMSEYHLGAYDNLFTALKKMSSMRIEQNKAQHEANRGGYAQGNHRS